MQTSNILQNSDEHLVRALELDLGEVLYATSTDAEMDFSFTPIRHGTERWYATAGGFKHELILFGGQWFDTKMATGGRGPLSLTMHMKSCGAINAMKLLLSLTKGEVGGASHATH